MVVFEVGVFAQCTSGMCIGWTLYTCLLLRWLLLQCLFILCWL